LYGYETPSLTLKEEQRLWVSESRVLRRIPVVKKEEVITGQGKAYNELHRFYNSRNIISEIKSRRT
jgi:hypothetical protein